MVSSTPPRGSFRSRLGQLNPAFAAAHNIPSPVKSPPQLVVAEERKKSAPIPPKTIKNRSKGAIPKLPISPAPVTGNDDSSTKKAKQPTAAPTTAEARIKQLIGKSRATGKLQASDAGLVTPLPTILFDFPSLVDTVDMSLDTNPDQLKSWESHMAETLTVVDFSDNEAITEFPQLEPSKDKMQHISNNSVERFRSVHTFRARRCKLHTFPIAPTLQESWSQLATLDLSGNTLTGEFPLLYLPKSIRELDISGNSLSSLKSSQEPSTSIDLPQLVSLDISNNSLPSTGISPIMHVPNLQRLNCGDNKIYNLSFIMKAIDSSKKSLTTLGASRTYLSDLDGEQPIDLTSFVSLLSVDLSGNSLCRVPQLHSSVQRLNVNENCIKGIYGLLRQDVTGELVSSSMVVLQIQRNKLKTLDPHTVAKLMKLNRLDLQNNSLKDLPVELGYLANLHQMSLEGNHLLSLRSSGLRGDLNDTKAVLAKLRNRGPRDVVVSPSCSQSNSSDSDDTASTKQTLESSPKNSARPASSHKSKTTLKTIPAEVVVTLVSSMVGTNVISYSGKHAQILPFQLLDEIRTSAPELIGAVDQLDISKNQLQTIEADWFALLPQLTNLEAQDNRLSSLPVTIQHVAFTQLNLSRNKLSAHAIRYSLLHPCPEISTITSSLQLLDLSANNLESFPPDLLRNFRSLHTLNLSRNRISSLQNIVDDPHPPLCHSLEHLNLGENQVENLGGDDFPLMLAAGCPNLQSLKLENNELQKIPWTLGLLKNLNILELRGNPQRMIRYEILEKSTTCVLEYMRNRMTAKTKERALKRLHELLEAPPVGPTEVSNLVNDEAKREANASMANTKKPSTTMRQTKLAECSSLTGKKTNETPSRTAIIKLATPLKSATPPMASRIPAPKTRLALSPVPLGKSTRTTPTTPTSASSTNKTRTSKPVSASKKNDYTTSPLLQELEASIAELAAELDHPGLSEAKRYATKKKLAMERSKRLREDRRLKQERDHHGLSRTSGSR